MRTVVMNECCSVPPAAALLAAPQGLLRLCMQFQQRFALFCVQGDGFEGRHFSGCFLCSDACVIDAENTKSSKQPWEFCNMDLVNATIMADFQGCKLVQADAVNFEGAKAPFCHKPASLGFVSSSSSSSTLLQALIAALQLPPPAWLYD